jgi:hypothetical protein
MFFLFNYFVIYFLTIRKKNLNSYILGTGGYWWLTVLLILAATGFAFYTYRNSIPPVSGSKRGILITLRSIAIALLLFIISEPVLTIISGFNIQPKLAVILDNSKSIDLNDSYGDRKELLKKAIENSDFLSLKEENLMVFRFAQSMRRISEFRFDSLNFTGELTNISAAIKTVTETAKKDNIRAILLISDGAFNSGSNPIYDADYFGKPIFTIGIGDSSDAKDISVQSILMNETAFINTSLPVSVNIKASGFSSEKVTVKLMENNQQFGEQIININNEQDNYNLIFEFTPKTEGHQKITANISQINGELTYKNNTLSEYIHVLKKKKKYAIFAGSPNPDLSFIKNIFHEDKEIEIKTYVQKQGSEFYEQPSESILRDAEIIIIIGFPIQSTSQQSLDLIKKELSKGKPLLFISGLNTEYNKLKYIEDYLPFTTISSRPQEFFATPDVKSNSISNPVMRITGTEDDIRIWNMQPPLFRTETFVKAKPESEVASFIKVNNVPLQEPLIITRNFQNFKSIAVIGYGLYRWKLLGYGSEISKGRVDTRDVFDIFIRNSIRWLSVDLQDKQVRIKTSKKAYTNNEPIEFIAEIYDASYNPLDNATITINIKSASNLRDLILTSLGNGRYSGKLGSLPQGDYYFTGTAKVNNENLGTDAGRFNVGEIALEYQNLKMNAPLLRNLSERTGGRFYTTDDSKKFLEDFKKLTKFQARSVTNRSEYILWNLWYLLALVILLLASEWFLRKKFGML